MASSEEGREPSAKECRQPLNAGKDRQQDFSLETTEEMPSQYLDS